MRLRLLVALLAASALGSVTAIPASAAPSWRLGSISDTTVAPGGELEYFVQATSAGDEAMDGTSHPLVAELPVGMQAEEATLIDMSESKFFPCYDGFDGGASEAPVAGAQSVVCPSSSPMHPGPEVEPSNFLRLRLRVSVDPGASGTLLGEFEISGGGAPTVRTVDPVLVADSPPPFGIDAFDATLSADAAGEPLTQAGGHPYDYVTHLDFNTLHSPVPSQGRLWPVGPPHDILAELPPGLVGNPTVAATCPGEQLLANQPDCLSGSQVGNAVIRIRPSGDGIPAFKGPYPIYNMEPPPDVPARFGFNVHGTIVTLDAELRSDGDYGLTVGPHSAPATLALAGSTITFWGVPASADHDRERACPGERRPSAGGPTCSSGLLERPFFRLPTSCTAPEEGIETTIRMDSWEDPGDFKSATIASHEGPGYPHAPSEWGPEVGITGCEVVPVKGKLSAQPTTIDTESPTGLVVHVEVPNPGLENPEGIASSDIKKVRVSLPQGVTINPSQAEGLGVCSPAQYESTELSFFPTPGQGCPDDSKIGSVEVVTPLLEETLRGDVYIAQQDNPSTATPGAENPFDSLLAIYVVIKNPQRGILVKLPGKVETDETTGKIVTTFDDLPQLPFSTFDFRFREGARAPLVTPPTCGRYETVAEFWGHSDPDGPPVVSTSSFEIVRGIGGGPCPPGGIPPFNPGFSAGAINPDAGSFSPFVMRLTRLDGEQNLTKFNSVLPPGVSAKIAGVEKCSEAAIAAAKAPGRTGKQELAVPSCPAGSQIGRSLAGAGVGSVLTYVPGKIYLAGPWEGAPLSVVAITPAVAGPFDVGVVVVRQALTLDPITAEVHVDGEKSDPIPHILEGIPLKLRDLRVYVDRENFTINPTSCDPAEVRASLFGSFIDVFNPADDRAVDRSSRFQAANCAGLGFKPALKLNLKGGTKRGGHPALKAVFKPRAGDANLAKTVVKLPRSAFLDQAHIRTICTRVQFAADACPKGAIYGKVTAFSPLLDEPLKGPAYLRSSNNKLPDLVFDLKGVVEIETSARIDSVRGGIRATFPFVPDAPLSRVVVEMQGGKKGLIQNSRNLCAGRARAEVKLDAHNGKVRDSRPVVRASCGNQRRNGKRSSHR